MSDLPTIYRGIPGTPTWFDGHLYDSSTEASVADYLKRTGQPFRPHPAKFRSRSGLFYKPDFLTRIGDNSKGYIEVKPDRGQEWLIENRGAVREWIDKLLIIRESIPDAVLAVIPWNEGYDFPRTWLLSRPGEGWRLLDGVNIIRTWQL